MNKDKLEVARAIIVEGRDDVDAVSRACDALIIPTHGFGITAETWAVIDKAWREKGLIILTDPDSAGERIRKMLNDRFPGSVQCYLAREDATEGDDIGIENADPDTIRAAIEKALELHSRTEGHIEESKSIRNPEINDLVRLGLAGTDGASELRAKVCRELGIGYGNAKAVIRKLKGFGIGIEELEAAVAVARADQ